jgi:hypothetical protein
MAAFPENDVELLRDYLPGQLAGRIDAVADALARTILPAGHPRPVESGARALNQARRDLVANLRHPAFEATPGLLRSKGGTGVYDRIAQHEFGLARDALSDIGANVPAMTRETLDRALRTQPLPFTFILVVEPTTEIDPETGRPIKIPGGKFERKGTLKGYSGPELSSTERTEIVLLCQLIGGGPERDFRLGLLRAECRLGLGEITAGLEEYFRLLRADTMSSNRRKHVALRAGFARLALGDKLFRSARTLEDDARAKAAFEYSEGVALVHENGVTKGNPLLSQVEAHAEQQQAKLSGHFNVLGFRDSFVPVQVHEFLENRAREHLLEAGNAAAHFNEYLSRANELEDLEAELSQELAIAQANEQIAAEREAVAEARVERTDNQLDAIESQQEFLVPTTIFNGIESFFGGGGFGSIFGIGSTLVGFNARHDELAIQHAGAEIDHRIAEHEVTIAQLEAQVARIRREFVETRLALTGGRRLSKDLFYALARTFEALAQAQLETAILFAYLYERALAYFIGKPSIRHIRFDYLDQTGGVLAAPGLLSADVGFVTDELGKPDLPKLDEFVEQLSLRQTYPIEFAQLQQTRRMDFVLSLYELDKRRPGSWQARLIRAEVELRGLIPPTGFSGSLTHMGRFIVRDRAATLDPAVDRLLPTPAEVTAALARQERGEAATAAVGGVVAFDLGPDTKELDAQSQTGMTPEVQRFSLGLMEGYGPAALWRLELRGVDPRLLADVVLTLHLRAFETDPFDLQPKVEELIARFEEDQELTVGDTLDRILTVPLRQRFPDALPKLATGPATLTLAPTDFVSDLPQPRVKAVLAQALDAQGRGVAGVGLEIARTDAGFTLARTTTATGFSEDLSAPPALLDPADRFQAPGDWIVRLADPAQAAALDDLRLFVVYEAGRQP